MFQTQGRLMDDFAKLLRENAVLPLETAGNFWG
jgi:hypothetical protein